MKDSWRLKTMNTLKRILLLSLLLSLFHVAPAIAHHSFSLEFDRDNPVSVEGKFVRLDWVNPHSWVYVAVENDDGTVTEWGFETPPPNVLYRQGWRKDFFNEGEILKVTGFAARDGSTNAWASQVYLEDDTRVLQMFGGDGPPER
jgi:hypothetical protein